MPSYRVLSKCTYIVEAADEEAALLAAGGYVRAQDTFDCEVARSMLLAGTVQPEAGEIEVMGKAHTGETHPWDVGLRIVSTDDNSD